MSLIEAIKQSDWRMSEGDLNEFTKRVLIDAERIKVTVDGNEVLASFRVQGKRGEEPRSIVFTSNRLVLESEVNEPDRHGGYHGSSLGNPVRRDFVSIPYKSIAMHAVLLNPSREPDSRIGVLRIWVPGFYAENSSKRWIDVPGDGKLDLHMLSGVLESQIAGNSAR